MIIFDDFENFTMISCYTSANIIGKIFYADTNLVSNVLLDLSTYQTVKAEPRAPRLLCWLERVAKEPELESDLVTISTLSYLAYSTLLLIRPFLQQLNQAKRGI